MKHLLSIESLTTAELHDLLALATEMKATRGRHAAHPLRHQCWGMMFSKSSTRTRVSFEVGIRELGGDVLFLSANDIQLGRGEPIKDTARVMGRMLHGAVIRTFAQQDVVDFAEYSGIPTINALTDDEHPCQILADLQTIQERLGSFEKKVVTFVGDGACNVPRSWMWAAARLDFELRIAAPAPFQPDPKIVAACGPRVTVTDDRSIPGFHLRDALDLVAKRHPGVLLRFGGHAMAAGCTVNEESFDEFEQGLNDVAQEWLDAATLTRRLDTDGPLAPEYRRADLVDTLHREVWGQGFAPPTFSEEVEVISQRLVGEKHLSLKLKHQGQPVDAIWFGHTEQLPRKVTLAFRLDADEWNGVRRVRFLVEGAQL